MKFLKRVFFYTLILVCLGGVLLGVHLSGRVDLKELLPGTKKMDSFAGDFMAARYAMKEGRMDEARRYLASALAKDPENQILLKNSYEFFFAEGDYEKALELATSYVELYPYPVETAHVILAMSAAKRGEFSDALALFADAKKPGQDDSAPSVNSEVIVPLASVWLQVGGGQNKEAMKSLEELKQLIALPLVQFQAALIADIAGNPAAAQEEFDAVLESAGHSLRVAQLAYRFYTKTGNPKKAEEAKNAYFSISPGAKGEDLFDDENSLRPVVNATQGLADFFMEIASFLHLGNQPVRAQFYASMALFMQPDFPHARLLLANILRSEERYNDALDAYKNITAPASFYWQARINTARMEAELKEYDRAKSLLLSLAEENKTSYDPYLTLADLLMDKKEYTQAAEFYSRAIARIGTPEDYQWVVFYARGICNERLKQWDNAEADFKKALELNPNQPDVLNYLAYSWLVMDKNIEQAHEMLKKALTQRPGDAHIIDSFGWALFKLAKYDEALAFLEQANEMIPNDPTTNDHLGDVYWQVGRKREARFQWQRALYFKPEPDEILVLEQKLLHGLPLPSVNITKSTSTPAAKTEKTP
jgi:tetratricopeptide (TPR) repeat protein